MKYSVTHRPQIMFALVLVAIAGIAATIAVHTQAGSGPDQDIAKLNRFVQGKNVNTASMQIFREGRDLIEAQNWQRAAEKFNEFITGYPKDKDLDAALYWYGYALQKQGRKDEAKAPLVRLINRFPGSSWRREAEALLVVLGEQAEVNKALAKDNCEIKTLALQSLFQADEERAIGIVTEALKANQSQCQGFTAAAVSMLGSHGGARATQMLLDIARNNPDPKLRLTAIRRLGEQNNEQITDELIKIYDADRTREIRVQILRALIEAHTARGSAKVLEIARSGDDLALRQSAIHFLSESNDAASTDELIRIYDAEKTREIRFQILRVLAERQGDAKARAKLWEIARQGETFELRVEAIRRLSEGNMPIDELLQLYKSETNLQIKQSLLRAFAENNDPRARAQLLEIVRGNDPIELRGYALRRLAEKEDDETVNMLVGMYDAEQNLQIKSLLVRAFGESNQKSALRKLMSIARNDPSIEMRKVAIRYLGESKDPEALKFLEDLLK
jgi:HEAT repeat protein